jgi:hypothetical protein
MSINLQRSDNLVVEKQMRNDLVLASFLIAFTTTSSVPQQNRPPEIPSHYEAASGKEFLSAKTITVTVTSRRSEDPDSPEDLERIRKKVLDTLPRIPLTLAPIGTSADLSLEMIVEPNVRYGMYHYQNAPYVYLLLRRPSDDHLVYCAYQRAGHLFSASDHLLANLQGIFHKAALASDGSLAACADQAMRPL